MMQIRHLMESDVERVVEIIAAHEEFDGRCAQKYYSGYFASPDRQSSPYEQDFVAVDSESHEVVGICGFSPDKYPTPGILWLSWFYVAEDSRGRGVGKALLLHTLARTKELGAQKVYLDTSSHRIYARSIQVYERAGFEIEGQLKDYYGKGEDMVILGLDLAPIQVERGPR